MLREEEVMDAVCVARAQWIEASRNFARVIQQVLSQYGADFAAIRQMDLNGPEQWFETSHFDEELAARDLPIDSPLGSRYIRLVELATECGGVLPEGILRKE
jgi:hypothetical protein